MIRGKIHLRITALAMSAISLAGLFSADRHADEDGSHVMTGVHTAETMATDFTAMPPVFAECREGGVLFDLRMPAGSVSFLRNRIALVGNGGGDGFRRVSRPTGPRKRRTVESDRAGTPVILVFEGANPDCRVEGEDALDAGMCVFRGSDPSRWRKGLRLFRRIRYLDLYPHIDLVYHAGGGMLKYEFIVHPGGNPGDIRLAYEGIDRLRVGAGGELLVEAEGVRHSDAAPIVYQGDGPNRSAVDGKYIVRGTRYAYDIGSYDRNRVLVIDPAYTLFIGGTWTDGLRDVKTSSSGYTDVLGGTGSSDFPTTSGAYQTTYSGRGDMFIAVFAPDGSLAASTLIGGSAADAAKRLDFDDEGNVVIGGWSDSEDYPTTPGAYRRQYAGGASDAVISRFAPLCDSLLFSGYIGGSGQDDLWGMAVDRSGNVYLTGLTDSWNYPITADAAQRRYGGGDDDVFVTKLSADGSRILYSTYLGGSNFDESYDIRLDEEGNAFICGFTRSYDFPTTPGALQERYPGYDDGFVAKFGARGSALLFSTYAGGLDNNDWIFALAPDGAGGVYVTGSIGSNSFPTTEGALQRQKSHPVSMDLGVFHLDATGSRLIASTYFGYPGVKGDIEPEAIQVRDGLVFVAGRTLEPRFRTHRCPCSDSVRGRYDAFLSIFTEGLDSLVYSGLFGGDSLDWFNSIDVSKQRVLLAGWTTSQACFHASNGTLRNSRSGPTDGMLVELDLDDILAAPEAGPGCPSLLSVRNYPNPVRAGSAATISYTLPKASGTVLELCDASGRVVRCRELSWEAPGAHSIAVDTRGLAPGVYYFRLTACGESVARKMVLLR